MLHDLFAWIVVTFLLAPLQSEITGRLEAARAPAAVVQGVVACAADAAPALVARAVAEPGWALSTAFGTWIGMTSPEAVLRDAAPTCPAAIAAARPFLAAG